MRDDIRSRLIEVAGLRGLITYKRLGREFNLHWRTQLPRELGEISAYEISQGRPPLSAIVVNRHTLQPGTGFWNVSGVSSYLPWGDYRNWVWEHWWQPD